MGARVTRSASARRPAEAATGTLTGRPASGTVNPKVNGYRAMRGLITSRDVVLHAFTIIRLWGLPTYVRCLRATLSRRPTTFLAVIHACRG